MKTLKILSLVAAAALLGACESAPKVRSNVGSGADLSNYHTYSFFTDVGTNKAGYSTPITSYFKDAIRRELDARGYRYVDDQSADLLVNFSTNSRENVDLRSTPGPSYGYYGYRGFYGYGGAIGTTSELETVRYKVGTANVDLVDARKKQLVWESVAEGKLTDKMMKDPKTAIDGVVTEMFSSFPARAAPGA